MTTNSPNQPNPLQQRNGYNPITFEHLQKPEQSGWHDLFGGFHAPAARWTIAPLFAFIFLSTQRMPFVAPLLILVLLGCLLSRMENRSRQIAAVPLSLAAIKLAFGMSSHLTQAAIDSWLFPATPSAPLSQSGVDAGLIWLPIFFSVCLIFIPNRESATFKIVAGASCFLLSSGMLPGQGFIAIFFMENYLLFFAIVIGIFLDVKTYVSNPARPVPQPAQ